MFIVFIAGVLSGAYAWRVGAVIRFSIHKHSFDAVVARSAERPPLLDFLWESGWDVSTVLVYDESDEIVKPADARSMQWKRKARALALCRNFVQPLWDHYYIAKEGACSD